MSVIDEIKQKTDIVEIIGQQANLTKAGRNFRALCPFHSEKRPSFFVYAEQQSWHCFGACNTGGDVFSFIMKKQGVEFGEALRFLAEKAGVDIPSRSEPDITKNKKEQLYQANEAAAQYFHNLLLNSPAGEKTRNYLAGRGLSLKTIIDFQLGYSLNSWEDLKQYLQERDYTREKLLEAGLIIASEDGKTHDRFRNRLIFPIKDGRGSTIGFGARALDDSDPKYLNSPQTPVFDKSGSLYGINLASSVIRQQNLAVIVEGYMDVITAHQNGFTNVIASMGTSVTEKQINTLKRLTRNIILALDADAAGEEAMLRCIDYENTLGAEVRVVVLPGGKDPDDVIREDVKTWQHLLDKALPVVDYTFDMATANLDLKTARDKSMITDRLLPTIAGIKDIVRQSHYLQKLARLVNVREQNMETALRRTLSGQNQNRRGQGLEPERKPVPPGQRLWLSSPTEEHCLALLLQYPELKDSGEAPLPEYFQNSENREIFITWQADPSLVRDKLDIAIWEKLDTLLSEKIPQNQLEKRYTRCVLRLKKEYLRNVETKKEQLLALEAETGGTGADIAKLKEQGIEESHQLREVFVEEAR